MRTGKRAWLARRRVGANAGVLCGAMVALLTLGCGGFFPPITTTPTTPTPSSTTGDFVYVANVTGSTLAGFSVSTSTAGAGTLTSLGTAVSLPVTLTAMAITPANSYLYVAGLGGIYAYSINTSTGVLTALLSGGVETVTNVPMASMDVSPDGQWLFALSEDGATVNEYGIDAATGALTQQPGATYTLGSGVIVVPKMVRVAPNGAFVAVALGTGGDVVFPLTTSTGALGANQQLGTGSTQTSDNALAIDSGSTYLYVARSGATTGVAVYAFNTNGFGTSGGLNSVAGSPFAAGAGPFAVLLDATGKFLYAANRSDNTISEFSIGTGGVLTPIAGSPVTSGSLVSSLARDNSGKYVLAAASGGLPDLTMYSFDVTTAGKLASTATAATGIDPVDAVLVVATH